MKKKISKKQLLSTAGNSLVLVAGNALYAFAVAFLVRPSGMVIGGVTGISIFLENFLPEWIRVSYIVLAINIGLFILGSAVLGKKFAITTAASTVLYPVFLDVFERIADEHSTFKGLNEVHEDVLLCCIVSGLLIGVSIGAVARTGASTGGMDIPPLVINKLTGAPVGTVLLCFDVVVIGMQFFTSNINQMLYGIIMIVINSFVVNQVMVMGNGKIQLSVISNNMEEVRATILTEMRRGMTLISSRKGLSGEPCEMVMSIISTRQLARAKKLILAADPSAFIIITRVSEVNGNGFSFKKNNDKVLERSDIN